ncbi:MAG: hypothetical protein AAGF49_12005, partial [Pseudomonadota bacterium]
MKKTVLAIAMIAGLGMAGCNSTNPNDRAVAAPTAAPAMPEPAATASVVPVLAPAAAATTAPVAAPMA